MTSKRQLPALNPSEVLEAIRKAATKSERTVTEYFLECHRLVAAKVK